MSTRFPFSLDRLRQLPPAQPGQRDTYHDTRLPYLKCSVTDRGSKSLVIVTKIRHRTRKKIVHRLKGKDVDPSLEALRNRARALYQDMVAKANGYHPGAIPTLGDYVKVWQDSDEMRRITDATRQSKLNAVRKHCRPILDHKLDEIRRADVRLLLTDLNTRYRRNASLIRSIIRQVYELAIDDEILPEDYPIPIPRKLKLKRYKRERRLSRDELARLFAALEAYGGHDRADAISVRLIVLLALFTAQRRGNILGMRWDEIDVAGRLWTIPPTKTKTRKVYRIGLHAIVLRLLQLQREHLMRTGHSGSWVFPSLIRPDQPICDFKKPWAWIVKEAQLEDFRFHDLRHLAASIAYEASQDLMGTQMFLQHSDSRTTADCYIHLVDTAPQIRATEAVVDEVCKAVGIRPEALGSRGMGLAG